MAGSDPVPEQLAKTSPRARNAPGISLTVRLHGLSTTSRALTRASVLAKWRQAIQGGELLQVDSLDSTQQAGVQFVNPNQVTAVKVLWIWT
jgi:hypothetical protein